jgi:hypothetical protein
MRNGPSLGYSCVENGSHPVSAALDFLDEGSGSFCGDTYYLRYLDNSLYISYPTDIGAMGTVDRVSARSIFMYLPWAFVMISSKRSPVPGCLHQSHSLKNIISTTRAAYHPLTMKEPSAQTSLPSRQHADIVVKATKRPSSSLKVDKMFLKNGRALYS